MKETKTSIPEIIMQATKLKAEKRVNILTSFLLPLPSKEAKELLCKIKNLGASVEFAESTFEDWERCQPILKELDEYFTPEYYYGLVSKCVLTLEQQKLFTILAIVYFHAKYFGEKCYVDFEGNPVGLSKAMMEWSDAAMEVIHIIFLSMAKEIPEDDVCHVIRNKISKTNEILNSFEEMLKF